MSKKFLSALFAAMTLGGVLTAAPAPADVSVAGEADVKDAHVQQSAPEQNYGTATTLSVQTKTNSTRYAFVKVTVPALPAGDTLVKASLRTFVTGTAANATLTAEPVSNNWTEPGLTWNNKVAPATTSPHSAPALTGWVDLPVTVTPGTTSSFRIRTNSASVITLSSSEHTNGNGPQVFLDTNTATTFPPTGPIATKILGMTTENDTAIWNTRVTEVGGSCGLESRRVYAQLTADGDDKAGLIQSIIEDGMMPVISYKVPNVQTLANGGYDAWLQQLNTRLNNYGAKMTVTYHHEPRGDMTPAQFIAGSQKFLTFIEGPQIAEGPILNGWLLDSRVSEFASYTTPSLLAQWDFVGVDSYQEGTAAAPDTAKHAARALPLLASWLDGQGHPHKPIGLGEYNGFTGATLDIAREYILATPELWFAVVWSTDGDPYTHLTGDRIPAFSRTKADPRAYHDPGVCP